MLSGGMTDALAIAQALIRCPSVTPADAGALGVLETLLKAHGFEVHRVTFSQAGTADVDNLYARIGTTAPHITFAGHTDVVPPGDETAWRLGAFSGEVKDGFLYGRGAVDMKGGIACSVAAVLQYLAEHGGKPRADGKGSISFLITGDEEDVSVNGTIKLLQWVAARGEQFDHCVLGEPSNQQELGDCIKVGRRGSVRHALCRRQAGPCRLSAARRKPGARYLTADRGAVGRAARRRQRAIPALQSRIHIRRCR
jgi:succinyl-diaminopimelate desuccinylase